jgi:hypothetical protein
MVPGDCPVAAIGTDPDDEKYIAAAIEGRAAFVVSGDLDFWSLVSMRGTVRHAPSFPGPASVYLIVRSLAASWSRRRMFTARGSDADVTMVIVRMIASGSRPTSSRVGPARTPITRSRGGKKRRR